jgi:LAS superfamily LD-carboxypeptidase LdcB
MKKKMTLLGVFAVMTLTSMCGADNGRSQEKNNMYGSIPRELYLSGKFEPSSDPQFVALSTLGIAENNGPHYLRRETAEALAKMLTDFHREHPTVKIFVQSSTRNFDSQKSIWNAKWRILKKSIADPAERAKEILRYSSMPGTSRHHWGSDFDINKLTNSYYERGEGKIIFDWLTANAFRYGFARPYTAGRTKGYNEEKWHWSYLPLSKKFLADWTAEFSSRPGYFASKGLFDGSDVAGNWADEYVEAINPECR